MSSEWVRVNANQKNDFFGEVRHRLISASEREVEVVIKPDKELGFELAMTALALDGSRSMLRTYAAALPPIIRRKQNKMPEIARPLASFLAENSRNQCAIAYWACGDDGSDIEPVGIMGKSDIEAYQFQGAEKWGGGTKLTPIVEYFWEQVFAETDKVGMAVILTDGAWDDDDHTQLLKLTHRICDEVSAGTRQLMKCVILGLETDDNKGELERIRSRFFELDDYEHPSDLDVWYTSWINELEDWIDLFIELVKDWSLGVGGFVESQGQKVQQKDEFNFSIQFNLPANATSFTLHLDDVGDYAQEIMI
ncbi:MAG: hypothetical protein COA78_17895 [Blastopirellula sp.]|nr:MAG: hypothetical protein COA78_17895 [Blastopirellula sp.]